MAKKDKDGGSTAALMIQRVALAVGLIAGCAVFYVSQQGGPTAPVKSGGPGVQLSVDNMDHLKDVFYGGQPWMVVCDPYFKGSAVKYFTDDGFFFDDEKPHSVARGTVLEAAIMLKKKGVKTGVIDCDAKLPSGPTVASKFKLDPNRGFPTLFVVANGQPHRQLTNYELGNPKSIVQSIQQFTVIKQHRVMGKDRNAQKVFNSKCFKNKNMPCLILLPKVTDETKETLLGEDEEAALKSAQSEYRKTNVIILDRAFYNVGANLDAPFKVRGGSKVPGTSAGDDVKALMFKQLGPPEDLDQLVADTVKFGKKQLRIGAVVYTGSLDDTATLTNFLAEGRDDEKYTPLSEGPKVQWAADAGKSKSKSKGKKTEPRKEKTKQQKRKEERDRKARLKRKQEKNDKKQQEPERNETPRERWAREAREAEEAKNPKKKVTREELKKIKKEQETKARDKMDEELKSQIPEAVTEPEKKRQVTFEEEEEDDVIDLDDEDGESGEEL